jgi:hypothetical protein
MNRDIELDIAICLGVVVTVGFFARTWEMGVWHRGGCGAHA